MMQALKELLCMTDTQCEQYLISSLLLLGYNVSCDTHENGKNYIFAYPESKQIIPVLLMAHWDTRRRSSGKLADEPCVLYEEFGKVENASGILGADDRAGIACILEAAKEYNEKPLILFTNYEESGGQGMDAFLKTNLFDEWKNVVYLAVSVDRKGHNQWVCYYENGDTELDYLMSRLGFVKEYGTWTDGADLAELYNLAHVNISCGGYNPHMADEFLLKDSFLACVERTISLMSSVDKPYVRTELLSTRTRYVTPSAYSGQGTAAFDNIPEETTVMVHQPVMSGIKVKLPDPKCDICGKTDYGTVYYHDVAGMFLCFKCRNRILDKYKSITATSAKLGIQDLQKERQRTREMNILQKKSNASSPLPVCPVCHKSSHVAWCQDEIGFVCTECALAYQVQKKDGAFDGRFWVIDGDVFFVRDNNILRASLNGQVLKECTPASVGTKYVKRCDACGRVGANISAVTLWKSDTSCDVLLCSACREDIGDLVDDYLDNTLPLVGSEDDNYKEV